MKTYTLASHSVWRKIRDLVVCVLIVLICSLLGFVVSLVWPQSYQASTTVIEPDSARVASINQPIDLLRLEAGGSDQGLYKLANQASTTGEQAFAEFIAAYTSGDTRRSFFLERELYRLQGYNSAVDTVAFRKIVADFSNHFSYSYSEPSGLEKRVLLSFNYHNAEGAAELLNAFVDHAAGLAAQNLMLQRQEKIEQLQATLNSAGNYYRAMLKTLQAEKLPSTDEIYSANGLFQQSKVALISEVRRKQLQAWHLQQELSQVIASKSTFKPVRVISLANAEGSVAKPGKGRIVFIAFIIGLLIALVFVINSYYVKRIRIVA